MERAVILKRDKTAAEGAKRAVNFSVFSNAQAKGQGQQDIRFDVYMHGMQEVVGSIPIISTTLTH
ncbi:hypothetical protein P1062_0206005 [Pasteurella multocida subsp. multocida P1062]|nr:hypothetical protein P1062_0206005 [Pasteurella multocida subsp. multocida P1062]